MYIDKFSLYIFIYLYYIMQNIKTDIDLRNKIHSALQSERPSLSSSSLRTYTSVLYNLHSKHLNQDHNNMEWFSQKYKNLGLFKWKYPEIHQKIRFICALCTHQ